MIQAKFGSNWPSGFRGEDFWKSLQTDDRRQVMAIAHTGELKKRVYILYFTLSMVKLSLQHLSSYIPYLYKFVKKKTQTPTQL